MIFVRLLPVIISLLILSAHFTRVGIHFLSLLLLILPFILLIRNKWIPPLLQLILAAGAAEWIRTLFIYVNQRQAVGEPYFRLILIIGTIALFTGLSALVFKNKALKERYNL